MRSIHTFYVYRHSLTPDALAVVTRRSAYYNKHTDEYSFSVVSGAPEHGVVLRSLSDSGLTDWSRHAIPRLPTQYRLRVDRDYTEHDLNQYQYLRATTGRTWPGGWRGDDGMIPLPRTFFPKRQLREWAYHTDEILLVTSLFRSCLEQGGLSHLQFRPTQVWSDTDTVLVDTKPVTFVPRTPPPRCLSWDEIGEEPWWEMTSDLVLPRVAPSMPLGSQEGDSQERTFGVWVYNNNPVWELNYRDEDLKQVEPFDAALTFERWRGSRDENRFLIVSQRFRQAVLKHGLGMGFVPVHVEGRPEPTNLDPPENTPPRDLTPWSEDDE